jgi:hypothetical protein
VEEIIDFGVEVMVHSEEMGTYTQQLGMAK